MERVLDIPAELLKHTLSPSGKWIERGKYSHIVRGPELAAILEREYGRPDLCLKIFRDEAKPLDEFYWGKSEGYSRARIMRGVLLVDCTKAQNLYARHGLAPRVYDIVLVNGENWAQVTDYICSDGKKFSWDRVDEITAIYASELIYRDYNARNFIGSRMTDWQFAYLDERYEEGLISRCDKAAWGSHAPYQQIAGLGINGVRDTDSRIEDMRWDETDFAGATVLDTGCNLGAFCQEASDRGAKRVIGVDLPEVANVAYEVANWRGYWNMDFIGANLPSGANKVKSICGIDTFDIVLCLAVRYTNPARWMSSLPGRLAYFEGHARNSESAWRPVLQEHFSRVEFLGMTRDHGPRPVFRCWR